MLTVVHMLSETKADNDSDEDEDDDDDDEQEDSDAYSEEDGTVDNDDDNILEDFNDDAAEGFNESAFSGDDELQDLSDIDLANVDDEDLSDMEFNDSEDKGVDDKLITDLNKKLKPNGPKGKGKSKGKGIDNNIFVSAEKFAEMLEEQGRTKRKHGGSNTFTVNDGASDKQIDWEVKRHQRLRGRSFGIKRKKSVQLRAFARASNSMNSKKFKH